MPELAQAILSRIAADSGNDHASLSSSALTALGEYSFPGNVRELENILERALALSDGEDITADDFQFSSSANTSRQPEPSDSHPGAAKSDLSPTEAYGDMEGYLEDVERQIISTALEESRWNKTATAKLLGVSFRSLRYRLKKLGLDE